MEAIEIFSSKKNNNKHWNKAKLHKKIVKNTLPIKEPF